VITLSDELVHGHTLVLGCRLVSIVIGILSKAEAGADMVALVVVAMVVLLGVEPGASREEFEEWSDPGGRKREVGD